MATGRRYEDSDPGPQAPQKWQLTKRIDAGHIVAAMGGVVGSAVFGVSIYIALLMQLAKHDEHLSRLDLQVLTNERSITRVEGNLKDFGEKIDKVREITSEIRERMGSKPDAPRR